MIETLQIGGLSFEIRRSNRRNTLGLTVDRGGELVVHAHVAVAVETLAPWVNKKLLWVHRKLALKHKDSPKMQAVDYVSGESFCFLGKRFGLKVVAMQEQPLLFDGTRFRLRRDARPADEHFRRWYMAAGTEWIRKRVERLSSHTVNKPSKIEIRDLGFRWGSCGKRGILLFNWKILQLPVRLVDYIIMHELIHLTESHHDPAFWKSLDQAMPDWKKRKDALTGTAKDYLVFGLTQVAH